MVNSAGSLVLEQRVIEETPDRSSLAENEIQNKRNTTRPNPPFTWTDPMIDEQYYRKKNKKEKDI